MKKMILSLSLTLFVCILNAGAQTASVSEADQAAIKQTALDYVEGWYEGNAERMERALHPDLAKRIIRTGPQGQFSQDVPQVPIIINKASRYTFE